MTGWLTRFFASKKTAIAMPVVASVIVLLSLVSFLPPNLKSLLHSLSIGLAVGMVGFARMFSDDLQRHKPWGREFSTKMFLLSYVLFTLVLIGTTLVRYFPRLF